MLEANGVERTQGAPPRTFGPRAMCPVQITMKQEYKIIQDPVNGPIKVEQRLLRIIDASEVQRLRDIKQLGMVYLVFPGAQHSRFEHSLGAMHIAGMMAERLMADRKEEIMAAALLHDIGHPPFSHSFEDLIMERTSMDHQEAGYRVITGKKPFEDSTIPAILEESGFIPRDVAAVAAGRGKGLAGKIISGTIDCDELDYLRRDAYFCGTTLGIVDHMRVIETIFADRDIFIDEKGVPAIEELLVARLMMYRTVYWHKTARIAQKMVETAISHMDIDHTIFSTTDQIMLAEASKNAEARKLIEKVKRRDLFKPVIKSVYSRERMEQIMETLKEEISMNRIFVDVIPPLDFSGSDRVKDSLRVKVSGRFMKLHDVSALSKSLSKSFSRRQIIVSCDPDIYDSVRSAIGSPF